MRFTLLKMAIAGIYARLNVNVFYINLLYVNNSVRLWGVRFQSFFNGKAENVLFCPR